MKVEKDGLSFDLPYADTKEYSFVCGVQVFTQKVWSDLKIQMGRILLWRSMKKMEWFMLMIVARMTKVCGF